MISAIRNLFTKKDFHSKNENIPKILYQRFRRLLGCSLLIAFCGIISLIVGEHINYMLLFLYILLAFPIAAIAFIYKYQIEYTGYVILEGTVISNKKVGSLLRSSSWCLIKTSCDILVVFPLSKQIELPPSSGVRVYMPVDAPVSSSDGYYKIPAIWCYELVSSSKEAS